MGHLVLPDFHIALDSTIARKLICSEDFRLGGPLGKLTASHWNGPRTALHALANANVWTHDCKDFLHIFSTRSKRFTFLNSPKATVLALRRVYTFIYLILDSSLTSESIHTRDSASIF